MSQDDDNNSVQSIKKKFEQQILDSKTESLNTNAKKTLYNRSFSESHIKPRDYQKTINDALSKSFQNRRPSVDSYHPSRKQAFETVPEVVIPEDVNFAFNRPQIDPRRKSQIKRKPAFRCGDNKYTNTNKPADNDVVANNQSFLYKHTTSTNDSFVNNNKDVDSSLNCDKKDDAPPSVLFALMKKSSARKSPAVAKKLPTEETKTDDVNHMLKKLEELLIKDKNQAKVQPPLPLSTNCQQLSKNIVQEVKKYCDDKKLAVPDKKQEIREFRADNVYHYIKTPDILNHLSGQNKTKDKVIKNESEKQEPLYAVPFDFPKPSEIRADSFESKRRRSIENERFLDSSEDLVDGVDKRNSAYAVSNITPDLHYLCTQIYDVPTDVPIVPEVVDFNVIKRECELKNSSLRKKYCKSSEENTSQKSRRPKLLRLEIVSKDSSKDSDSFYKMADSGMSSMEASPDLEDTDLESENNESQTDKRRNYVTRISSNASCDWSGKLGNNTTLNKCYNTLRKHLQNVRKQREDKLFDVCLLVGYNSLKKGYVKSVFPPESKAPEQIEQLIFPHKYYSSALRCTKSSSMNNVHSNSNLQLQKSPSYNFRSKLGNNRTSTQDEQNYSLVLTDENGIRKFGYCRKILPENSEIYLPMVYCIVTEVRAPGFYFKVLQELESRHGQTDFQQKSMLRQLFDSKIPKPGQHLYIKFANNPERPKSGIALNDNHKNSTVRNFEKTRNTFHSLNDIPNFSKNSEKYTEFTENYGKLQKSSTSNLTNGVNYIQDNLSKNSEDVKDTEKCSNSTENYGKLITNNISYDNNCTRIDKIISGTKISDQNLYEEDLRSKYPELNISITDSEISDCSDDPPINNPIVNNKDRFSLINKSLMNSDKNFTEIVIKRPYDLRLENNELSILFECLNVQTIMKVFASLLIERKVVLVGESLSKLSGCIEGLQSSLYPLVWQHTMVTVLPHELVEITNAPIPILAGIVNTTEQITVDEGILVNIDTSTILSSMGDEHILLPRLLRDQLIASLNFVANSTSNNHPTRNVLLGEAFLKVFVACFSGYENYFENDDFDKSLFVESQPKKSIRLFLEWFSETTMFNHFIKTKTKSMKTKILQNTIFEPAESDEFLDLSCESESYNDLKENCNNENEKLVNSSNFFDIFDARMLEQSKNVDVSKMLFGKPKKFDVKKSKSITDKLKDFLHST